MKPVKIDPPYYLYLFIGIMVLLHFVIPVTHFIHFPLNLFGLIVLIPGIALNLSADKAFRVNNTTVKPILETNKLITTGIFHLTRNPMYLGFVLILLGIGILMGTLTPFLAVIVFAFFMDVVFIRYEEQKLEKAFQEKWVAYTKKVRRWI